MVLSTVIQVGRIAVKAYLRYNKYEAKLFQRAYRGVPRGIARGARHGYVAGSIIGSLIGDDTIVNGGNALPKKETEQSPSRSQYKTRRRRTVRNRCWNPSKYQSHKFN